MASTMEKRRMQLREHWTGMVLIALFVFVALLGGGSRVDIDSLVILRPVAAFAFFIGLAAMTTSRYAAFRPLILFCAAILVAIAVQLVPLPPGLWAALPGREPFSDAASLVGMADVARPISLYPSYTWNAFFAAMVPMSVLSFFIAARPRWRHYCLNALLVIGLLSAILALLQVNGPRHGALYFYAVTNETSAVGLFANRNHNAVLMALLPPLLVHFSLSQSAGWRRISALFGAILWVFLAFMILAIGSRLGLLAFFVSTVLTVLMIPGEVRRKLPVPSAIASRSAILAPVAVVAMLVIAGLLATNSLAMERLFSSSLDDDLRVTIVPTTLKMIGDFFPFGGGGGTFPETYYYYESVQALGRHYVNHVHNDYLEVAYAYGLPGILLMLAGVAMIALYGVRAWFAPVPLAERMAARAAVIGLVVLLIGSATDYPLRTPMLATAGLLFAATLLRQRDSRERRISG